MVTRKEFSAKMFRQYIDVFRCPICDSSMEVVESKSFICSNRHTFDIAKQGYVNLLTKPVKTHYDEKLFDARHKIIVDRHFFSDLHDVITNIIHEHDSEISKDTIIFDAGCGEGSHLHNILALTNKENLVGVGLDISKEGIKIASRQYKEALWIVGDLANTPLVNDSCAYILNILSPANYQEFRRLLQANGIMIKVVPRPNYLIEVREVLFHSPEKREYQNDGTISLFQQNFNMVDMIQLTYEKKLDKEDLTHLLHMTPLTWNAEKEQLRSLFQREKTTITVDFDILVGRRKN